MSAWTTGIGLGLEAARMQQQRDQFAQEQAFRQQQAAINNAQQDRQFAAYQTADVRDFDAMQQWRAFQQEQIRNKVAEDKAALDRELLGQQATAQVFKAIAAPDQTQMMPGMAMGEGSQNYNASAQLLPHPSETLDDNTLMNASPQALHAYVGARQNRAALQKRRQFGINQVEQARGDGSLKLVDPRTAQEWADLGLYADGTIRPDEMPVSMAKQREQQHEAMAQYLAMEQDAAGNYTSNPQVYDTYKRVPFEMLKPAYEMKSRHDLAIEVARIRQATQQGAGANGATIPQRLSAAKTMLTQAEKEYRALTGQAGKAGALVEPSSAIRKSAERFAGGSGDWFKTDATQERHVRMVAAWEKYQQALSNYSSVLANASADAPQRGLLDGPESQSQPGADPETIFQQLEAEMPNATDEQIAAELQRRLQGG